MSDEESWPTGEQFADLARDILNEWLPGRYVINEREWKVVRHDHGWRLEDPYSEEYWDFGQFKINNYRF